MQCFSLLYKVLGVSICVYVCVCERYDIPSECDYLSKCFISVSMLCVCLHHMYVSIFVCVCVCTVVKSWTRPGVQRLIRLVVQQIIKYVTGEELQK